MRLAELVSHVSVILSRIVWTLGFVRIRALPEFGALVRGGTLPLTIILRPTPHQRKSLSVELSRPKTVSTSLEIPVVLQSARARTIVHGENIGRTEVTIRVEPTIRLGRFVQTSLSWLAALFNRGFSKITLSVEQTPIFVVAPHPDDEALFASGVIANAIAKGNPVKVLIVTNGDHIVGKKEYGLRRQAESVAAMTLLGLDPKNVVFLGYPGDVRGLLHIMNNYINPETSYVALSGATETYGGHGLGNQDFHSWLTGEPARYNSISIYNDVETLVRAFRPQHLYTSSRFDEHPEHRAVYYLLVRVVQSLGLDDGSYGPTLHTAIVHDVSRDSYEDFWECDHTPPMISMDLAGDDLWPIPIGHGGSCGANTILEPTPPPNLALTSLNWEDAEILPVPVSMQSSDLKQNLKCQVLEQYHSQEHRYLMPFCKRSEVFWQEELPKRQLLALAPLNIVLRSGELTILSISLVRPAKQTVAVSIEVSDNSVIMAPAAVLIHVGRLTATFAVKAMGAGRADLTAIYGTVIHLAAFTTMDASSSVDETVSTTVGKFAN
jgi:LmbE family N-acetylglucosaminyl deacetylase